MSDRWTDGRTRHLVNFLVNSPAGTYFIDSVNISGLVADRVVGRFDGEKDQ
jgi:hypothetical protein